MTAPLPEPLTPADCDLKDFKFMPLDVARLRDSDMASEQTPEENWAAVLLWAASWHQVPAASMPDSENWIAKAAGYMMRGRIDARWKEVKDGAMRGFVLCRDGRWYHPVVAEKANESWIGKLKQRLKTECARIKKHNDRHGTCIPFPDFESWMVAGCPVGQQLFVPRDKDKLSLGTIHPCPSAVPSETSSNGQRQRQGEGQGQITTLHDDAKDSDIGGACGVQAFSASRVAPLDSRSRANEIAVHLTAAGVRGATAINAHVFAWSGDERVTKQMLDAAMAIATKNKGAATVPVAYLKPIIADLLEAGRVACSNATAALLPRKPTGTEPKGIDESYEAYDARIRAALEKRGGTSV